jgi:thioesterase domain-containing protein
MCDGALIAQQMILELESEGQEVALFTVFDTWVLENSQIRFLWEITYYLQRLRTLRELGLKEHAAAARRVWQRLLGRNGSGETAWEKKYWPGQDFEPPQFQAPVLLFKRRRQPYYYVRDPKMGWGARSKGGVDIHAVDCGHFELLRPPHVQVIGQRLAHRLHEIHDRARHSASPTTVVSELIGLGSQDIVNAVNWQT